MKKLVILASIALMLVVAGCAPKGVPPEPTPPGSPDTLVGQAFRPGMVIADDYSPPWDLATGDMIFAISPEGFSDVTSGISVWLSARSDDYIYHQGYYYDQRAGGWVPFEYDGPRFMVDGAPTNWIEGTVTATLDFPVPFDRFRAGENYVLVYICEWDAGWRCGPRTLGDTTHHWTIQSLTLCGAGAVVDGAACRAVAGAITEICANRADDDHDGDTDCADVDCTSDPACTGVAPAGGPSCTDSDGGADEAVAGRATVVDSAGTEAYYYDRCVTAPDGSPAKLLETFCSGTALDTITVDCAMSGRACLAGPTGGYCGAACVPDTDGTGASFTGEIICNDGRDNDCNGAIDCADSDCAGYSACAPACIPDTDPSGRPVPGEASCEDSRDNDCDGTVDCADSDCAGYPRCAVAPAAADCQDGDGGDDPATASYAKILSTGTVYEDVCSTPRELKERACSGDVMTSSLHECTIGSGSCESDPASGYDYCAPPVDYCQDMDAGSDPTTPSFVRFRRTVSTAVEEGIARDSCSSATLLVELGCSGTGRVLTSVDCTSLDPTWKCQVNEFGDSFCAPPGTAMSYTERADFCTDDDGGDNPTVPSVLKFRVRGTEFEFVETCKDATTVMEYWCTATGTTSSARPCSAGTFCREDAMGRAYCG